MADFLLTRGKRCGVDCGRKKDLHVSYFYHDKDIYQATIKSTQDKKELYVVTIFKTNQDELKRAGKNKTVLFEKVG